MSGRVREKQVEKEVIREYFSGYDWTRTDGDVDVTISSLPELGTAPVTYLWAEAKRGKAKDLYASLVQVILTVGKARTFEKVMPPYYLGAIDAERIAFVDYSKVMGVFSKTDFNWNVAPSDHDTREFRELYALLKEDLERDVVVFEYAYDGPVLRKWIARNFREDRKEAAKVPVGKNNFTFVYYDWVKSVKDTIAVDWDAMQKAGILDCDFFLADLMSKDGMSIKEKLKVVLEKTKYKVLVNVDLGGMFGDAFKEFHFKDGQKAYNQFWNRYERPPKPVYQRHILERRDLLVPQDIREVEGSYYTPEPWVRLSQEYLAKALGEDWQDEYYVWDCAAGSGNLLRGLTNRYNIYASTLSDSDVKVMHDAIDMGTLNLVRNNVFQFDFLNDAYVRCTDGSWMGSLETCEKIPESLRSIIADPSKRERLLIYINAPWKEATNGRTSAGTGKNNAGATNRNRTWEIYGPMIGAAVNELFAQFTIRIAREMSGCVLAEFSKLKILQAPNFSAFRKEMGMRLDSLHLMPADTFDNVDGDFPAGFQVYRTGVKDSVFSEIESDVWTLPVRKKKPVYEGVKTVVNYDGRKLINKWASPLIRNAGSFVVGYTVIKGNDFQNSRYVNIYSSMPATHGAVVSSDGLLVAVTYHAVRSIPEASWLNDRDQFLAPKDSWAGDLSFQTDCLVWSIFNNVVREENGVCHWIPFYEDEVDSPAPFNSRFMADFLHGKVIRKPVGITGDLFEQQAAETAARTAPMAVLSDEAQAVLDAGREIWRYYMTKPGIRVNASFLDIRAWFQGYRTTDKGRRVMNVSSEDETYMAMLRVLRSALKVLEARIGPKVYEYGFLVK